MRKPTLLLMVAAALLPLLASSADLAALIRDGSSKEALAAIRSGADVNTPQPDGTTPLMWAVVRADIELAKELLQRGAKPGGRNALGATVLSEAIATNDR